VAPPTEHRLVAQLGGNTLLEPMLYVESRSSGTSPPTVDELRSRSLAGIAASGGAERSRQGALA